MYGNGTGTGTARLGAAGDEALRRHRGCGHGRGRRVGAAALAALGLWLGLAAVLGGPASAAAQTLRSQTFSQQYYSPQAQAQRRRNTCIMQRQVTPDMATMCGPELACGHAGSDSYRYRYHYGAGTSGSRR